MATIAMVNSRKSGLDDIILWGGWVLSGPFGDE